jgi:HipA-like protein
MRKLAIYRNKEYAGTLTEKSRDKYVFRYDDTYYADTTKPAVSLTLPKSQQEYSSPVLFPFFFNMLSEGVNRQLQSRLLKIDDTIGAITVKPIE